MLFVFGKEHGGGKRSREDGPGICKGRARSCLAKKTHVAPQESLGMFLGKISTRSFGK